MGWVGLEWEEVEVDGEGGVAGAMAVAVRCVCGRGGMEGEGEERGNGGNGERVTLLGVSRPMSPGSSFLAVRPEYSPHVHVTMGGKLLTSCTVNKLLQKVPHSCLASLLRYHTNGIKTHQTNSGTPL